MSLVPLEGYPDPTQMIDAKHVKARGWHRQSGRLEFQGKYRERFAAQPVPGPLAAFAEYLRKDSAKWDEVIHTAHVKIE